MKIVPLPPFVAPVHLLLTLVVSLSFSVVDAADDIAGTLQKGLFEEEANQNFPAAIDAYKALIASHENDRKLAATAYYRLGECFRKLGRTNDAIAQYQRVLASFGDHATLATLCRQNLAGLGARPEPAGGGSDSLPGMTLAAAGAGAGIAVLEQRIALLQAEAATISALLDRAKTMSRSEFLRMLPTIYPDAALSRLFDQLAALRAQAAAGSQTYTAEHPEMRAFAAKLESLEHEIDKRGQDIIGGLETKLDLATRQIETMRTVLANTVGGGTRTAGKGPAMDEASRARMKELLQQELGLAEQLLKEQKQRAETGMIAKTEVAQFERDVLGLRRQLLEVDGLTQESDRQDWRALMEAQIQLAEAAAKSEKQKHDAGRTSPADVARLQRDVLALKRELLAFETQSASTPGAAGAGDPTASAGTSEEDEEIRRIQSIIKNSPDLINAANVHVGTWDANPVLGMPLHKAAQQGQLVVARFLLDHGAEKEARDGYGRTALSWAAANGHRAMTELLLNRGADVDAAVGGSARYSRSLWGFSPLHFAAQAGYRNVCETLLAKKASVNARSYQGETALHLAASRGFHAIVELLVERGADVNARDTDQDSPLHLAVSAKAGARAMLDLLLSKGAEIDAQNQSGSTTLFDAVVAGNVELVELLLKKKANPNLAGSVGNETRTPLIQAILVNIPGASNPAIKPSDSVAIIRLLLDHGADPNATTSYGSTLLIAAGNGKAETVALLLSHGANPNVRDNNGYTPLALSISGQNPNRLEVVEALLKGKADVNQAGFNGETPLFFAAAGLHTEIVRRLLDAGAEVNVLVSTGESPLSIVKNRLPEFRGPPPNTGLPTAIGSGFRSIPSRSLRPAVVRNASEGSDPTEAAYEIVRLLESRGARDDLRRLFGVTLSRNLTAELQVFVKSTNTWNTYTLFELIAMQSLEPRLAFPDFSHLSISRLEPKTAKTEDFRVDVQTALDQGDCSADRFLAWGDIVDIPIKDHLLNAQWTGLNTNTFETLQKCLERTVRLSVAGVETNIVLRPFRNRGLVPAGANPPQTGHLESRINLFRLRNLVLGSGLLLTSSDLNRVKVRRTNAVTKAVEERIFRVSQQTTDHDDLWLRDGDVVEVPNK